LACDVMKKAIEWLENLAAPPSHSARG